MVKQIKNNPERCVVLQKVRECSIKSNDEKKMLCCRYVVIRSLKMNRTEMLETIASHLQIQTQRNGTEKLTSQD